MPKAAPKPAPKPRPKPKTAPRPKLVNRGPAGLLSKISSDPSPAPANSSRNGKVNNIAPALMGLLTPIDGLTPDPVNARLHPERNMQAIELSLSTYGQVKPIVVRRQGMVVMAGNGTLQAAKNLGWTKIAATIVDMDEATAAGFGIADNRTAELAKWDFEIVARLDALITEAGLPMVGWSVDEMEVLRAADWTPPAVDESAAEGIGDGKPLLISITPDEQDIINQAVNQLKTDHPDSVDLSDGACLTKICLSWLQQVQPKKPKPVPKPKAK